MSARVVRDKFGVGVIHLKGLVIFCVAFQSVAVVKIEDRCALRKLAFCHSFILCSGHFRVLRETVAFAELIRYTHALVVEFFLLDLLYCLFIAFDGEIILTSLESYISILGRTTSLRFNRLQ